MYLEPFQGVVWTQHQEMEQLQFFQLQYLKMEQLHQRADILWAHLLILFAMTGTK